MTFLSKVPPAPWQAAFRTPGGHNFVTARGRIAIDSEAGTLVLDPNVPLVLFDLERGSFLLRLDNGTSTIVNRVEAMWLHRTHGWDLVAEMGGVIFDLQPRETV